MGYYVQIESTNNGFLTNKCGTKQVADRAQNTASDTAGANFARLNSFKFDLFQPHNLGGAATGSSAPFRQGIEVLMDDFETVMPVALNTINGHDRIKTLTLNLTGRRDNKETLLEQYVMEDGILTDVEHIVPDQRDPQAQNHRGQIRLKLSFQKVTVSDKVTNSQGVMQTVAA